MTELEKMTLHVSGSLTPRARPGCARRRRRSFDAAVGSGGRFRLLLLPRSIFRTRQRSEGPFTYLVKQVKGRRSVHSRWSIKPRKHTNVTYALGLRDLMGNEVVQGNYHSVLTMTGGPEVDSPGPVD